MFNYFTQTPRVSHALTPLQLLNTFLEGRAHIELGYRTGRLITRRVTGVEEVTTLFPNNVTWKILR